MLPILYLPLSIPGYIQATNKTYLGDWKIDFSLLFFYEYYLF